MKTERPRHRHRALLLALALVLPCAALVAGAGPAEVREVPEFDVGSPLSAFDQAVIAVLAEQADETLREDPDHAPGSRSPGSPAASSIAPSVVESAGISELLAVALDSAFGTGDPDQAITLTLTPFALVAANRPEVLERNSEYLKYGGLRRIEASLTLGGKPEEMPEAMAPDTGDDGDAAQATPEATRRITDIVIVQGKVRLLGSRDRRDHWREYRSQAVSHAQGAFAGIGRDIARDTTLGPLEPEDAPRYQQLVRYFRAHPDVVTTLGRARADLDRAIEDVNARVDHEFLVTLEVSAEIRSSAVGRDKLMVGLIAEGGGGGYDFTANARYRADETPGSGRMQELQVAAQVAKKLLRDSVLVRDGLDLSLSLLGQVRNQDRDDLASLTAKLDLPVGDGLRIPVSVTWASQSDLVDESIVRGNFGLSYDLSALRRKGDGS